MRYIPPDQYAAADAYDLLKAAEAGRIGFDQRLIHALVDQPERTLPGILRFVEDDYHAELISDVVLLLHELNPPEAVPIYIDFIRDDLYEVSDELAEAVAAAGERMVQPLLDLHGEIGEEDAGEIAFLLASLGIRDPRILKVLAAELEYDAGHGALCLGLYGDPAAIPHLHRIIEKVDPNDKYLRHQIEQTIRQLQESQDQPRQPEPFDIFSYYPEQELPKFDAMSDDEVLELAVSAPADVREGAVESFRGANLTPPVRRQLFEVATTDAEPRVRGAAWETLAGSDDSKILAGMRRAARDGNAEERAGAVVALASAEELTDEDFRLIEALYEMPDAREKALEAMWKSLDRRFQPYMLRHLQEPDISPNAVLGVGYLGMVSEANRLIPWFKNEDLRPNALVAYALATPVEISRGRMKPLLRRIDTLANGLSSSEEELVKDALDQRLMLHGLDPVFALDAPEPPSESIKVGRNDPCPCGSGKKYKKCHGA